jgi:hypothetical protein
MNRTVALTMEMLDPKMLSHPFEECFDRPTTAVYVADLVTGQIKPIGDQEFDETLNSC